MYVCMYVCTYVCMLQYAVPGRLYFLLSTRRHKMSVPEQNAADLREEGSSSTGFDSFQKAVHVLSRDLYGNFSVIWPPGVLARLANAQSDLISITSLSSFQTMRGLAGYS